MQLVTYVNSSLEFTNIKQLEKRTLLKCSDRSREEVPYTIHRNSFDYNITYHKVR